MKNEVDFDSSSDDGSPLAKPATLIKFNEEPDPSMTSSSSSRQDNFRLAREEYKQQRMARIKEAQQMKKREFGSSSED